MLLLVHVLGIHVGVSGAWVREQNPDCFSSLLPDRSLSEMTDESSSAGGRTMPRSLNSSLAEGRVSEKRNNLTSDGARIRPRPKTPEQSEESRMLADRFVCNKDRIQKQSKELSDLNNSRDRGNKSQRVLVVVICSTRASSLVYDSFEKYVLKPLNADLALSVSLRGGEDEEGQSQGMDKYRENAKFIWEVADPVGNNYSEYFGALRDMCKSHVEGESALDFLVKCSGDHFPSNGGVFGGLGGAKGGSGYILWFYRWLALANIMKEGLEDKYTHVIITRSDYKYIAPHPDLLPKDKLLIPQGEDYNGITDRHTVIPMELAFKVLNTAEELSTHSATQLSAMYGNYCSTNAEGFFKLVYDSLALPIARFPRIMYTLFKQNDGSGRNSYSCIFWSCPDASAEAGPGVKYKYESEHKLAMETKCTIGGCAKPSTENAADCKSTFRWHRKGHLGALSDQESGKPDLSEYMNACEEIEIARRSVTQLQIAVSLVAAGGPLAIALFASSFSQIGGVRTLRDTGGFMITSASLLLCNKWAITATNAPVLVTFCQLAFTSAIVLSGHKANLLMLDNFGWVAARRFIIIAAAFLAVVVLSSEILAGANLETMVTIRSSAVVAVLILEIVFLGADFPSSRSAFCLCLCCVATIMVGIVETQRDSLHVTYGVIFWYAAFCFDQIYIKHVISDLKLTTWTNVAYTNTIAAFFLSPLAYSEYQSGHVNFTWQSCILVASTCVLGVSMSYFSYAARDCLSATSFTMLGNACKIGSIVGNQLLWAQHASGVSLIFAMIAVGASYAYTTSEKDSAIQKLIKGGEQETRQSAESKGV